MLVLVPLLLIQRPKDEAVFGNEWGDLALKLGLDILAGLLVGGFMMNLVKEITGFTIPALIVGIVSGLFYVWPFAGFNLPLGMPVEVKVVPILLLFLVQFVWTVIQARLWWGLLIVGGGAAMYLPLAYWFKPVFSWWVVLVPVLGVALFYVGMMYVKDAKSIHPVWAGFLGLLRCAVYATLAFVFLLPGCQMYDETKTFPAVLVLFDVSGSMLNTKDDRLEVGQKPETLLTRQDKVVKFLTTEIGPDKKVKTSFVQRLLEKTPAHAYRFGMIPDEANVLKLDGYKEGNKLWTVQQWNEWLRPEKKLSEEDAKKPLEEQQKIQVRLEQLYEDLVTGTNVPGSAAKVAKGEAANYVQAILIISDGQSNVGSSDSLRDFKKSVNNPKHKIHVFTIGVGGYRDPANIHIEELQVPQIARPDDNFPGAGSRGRQRVS